MSTRTREPGPREAPDRPSFEVESAQVLALAAEVLQAPTPDERRDAAEALKVRVLRLPGAFPGEKVQMLLRRLLADRDLGERHDGKGTELRRAFVAANQALGFPWALEIDPGDLKHLGIRPPHELDVGIVGTFGFVSAIASLMWNGLWFLGALSSRQLWEILMGGFFAAGAVHSIVSVVTLVISSNQPSASTHKWLSRLGKAALLGPLGAAIYALGHRPNFEALGLFFLGLMVAGPSMVTAGLCALTAKRFAPEAATEKRAPSAAPPEPP